VTKNVNSKKKTKELIDLLCRKQGKKKSFNQKQQFSSGSLSSTTGRDRGVVYSMDGGMPVVAEEEVPQAKEATTNRVRKT